MVKSYISLTKPRICLLVLITTYLGYYIGLRSIDMFMTTSDEWLVFFHLVLGTLLSSAGACALNQAIEYKSDRKMKRTSNRAIPSGIISPKKGLLFGTILSIFGISYLLFNISTLVSFLSFITIFTYIAIYTPMKKFSSLNTLIGAIPGALPPVGGWFAANSEFSSIATLLFGIMFCWQIPHFLSLAYMYAKDYEKGGFKMLPSIYSNQIQTRIHIVFFTISLISITFYLYLNSILSDIYLYGNFFLSLLFLFYVTQFVFSVTRDNAKKLFLASIVYLPLLLLLVILSS